MIAISGCQQLVLGFSYVLSLHEDANTDRARVEIEVDGSNTVVADNGDPGNQQIGCGAGNAGVGNLRFANWTRVFIDLSSELPASNLRVRFVGETFDGNANNNQGFLIDNVRISCSRQHGEFQANVQTRRDQWRSTVAALRYGGFVVVWEGSDIAEIGDVWARVFNVEGAPVGSDFRVNTYTPDRQGWPATAGLAEGGFVVVWQSYGGSASDDWFESVQARIFDSFGEPKGPQFQVNTYTSFAQERPTVAGLPGGGFVAAWQSFGSVGSDNGDAIQARLVGPEGVPLAADFLVNDFTSSQQFRPAVAAGSNGFVIVWQSAGSPGTDGISDSAQARLFDPSGLPLGNQFQVNAYTGFHQNEPSVSIGPDGDFVVVWQNLDRLANPLPIMSVHGRLFDSAGGAQGGDFEVSTYTSQSNGYPSVSAWSEGGFVVAWQAQGAPGSDTSAYAVQARLFNPSGAASNGPFQVNEYTSDQQVGAEVAAVSDDSFVVVWTSQGSQFTDVDGDSVQARLVARGLVFADGFESGDTAAWVAAALEQ